MFDAAARGELDVLWVACTNPAVSMPDLNVVQEGLRQTPLVVVQDCLKDTETAEYADVLLPAATWGEKRGTMTNSERLVTRSDAALPAPGEAVPTGRSSAMSPGPWASTASTSPTATRSGTSSAD